MSMPHERTGTQNAILATPGGAEFIDRVFSAIDDFQRAGLPPLESLTGRQAKEMAGRIDLMVRALGVVFSCPLKRRAITVQQLATLRPASMDEPIGASHCEPLVFRRQVEADDVTRSTEPPRNN